MSSWANLHSNLQRKKEPSIRYSFTPLTYDYAHATLSFLYAFTYTQRTAEPFYIHDAFGYFQPLLNDSPILHYLKESSSSSINLYSDSSVPVLVNSLSLNFLKRSANSILRYNPETDTNIKQFLTNIGVQQQSFDVGIVLQTEACVTAAIKQLEVLQTMTDKKTLKVFVATEHMDLLQEFATKGNSTWSYVSLLRHDQASDTKYLLQKTLAELRILRNLEYVAVAFGSSVGKLIYLTSNKITLESQILSLDGKTWKAME